MSAIDHYALKQPLWSLFGVRLSVPLNVPSLSRRTVECEPAPMFESKSNRFGSRTERRAVMDFLTLLVLVIQVVKTIARMGDDDTN